MKLRALLMGALLAMPVIGTAGPAHACSDDNRACALINRICDKVVGPCIP